MPEGGYSVVVPAIPEICTFGETLPEARRMAKDAVRCFL
jgi:predicted RNase H-like HicB family nuclease